MEKDFFIKAIDEIIEIKSLEKALCSGKKLRIKIGVDPTSPDIHLGHAVLLRKLRDLQKEGHKIIFLIGDYTTKIGDPSGCNTTRPMLSDEEIKKNSKTYLEQVGKILDVKKTEIRRNSEWYKKMSFADILKLAGKFTVSQILERDDFEKRLKAKKDVHLHEILYPIMQAYDSVALKADVEFGGSDQRFNMLAGRELQKKMGFPPQNIVMTKLLVGLDGKEKMSKSLGNYIGISESPEVMFGKTMSISDDLILTYFELCTDLSLKEIESIENRLKKGENPRDVKFLLAEEIVEIYHGKNSATEAKEEFLNVFAKKELPTNIPEVSIEGTFPVFMLVHKTGGTSSISDARRLVEQGGVKVDGTKITDSKAEIATHSGMIIQVGKKKFYKIK